MKNDEIEAEVTYNCPLHQLDHHVWVCGCVLSMEKNNLLSFQLTKCKTLISRSSWPVSLLF